MEKIEKHLYRRQYQTAGGDWSTLYYGIFTDWQGKRRTLPLGSDLKAARDALALRLADNVKHVDFDEERRQQESRLTLSQWGKLYFEEMIKPDKASLEWQRLIFKRLESRLGDKFLDQIDETAIDDYRDKRLRESITKHGKPLKDTRISHSTVNRELAILRLLLRLAKRKNKIKVVPAFNLQSEKSLKRDRTATEQEYGAILANMPRHYQRPLIGLYETATRINELLRLTWDRVFEKDGFIRFRAKDVKERQPRSVPISPALQVVFAELRAEQKCSKVVNLSGRVFTRPNGRPIDSIRKPFEAACGEAKIDNLHLHDFRHTCITRWAMEGKPVGAIMAASGHHSFSMHDSYVNLREHHLRAAFCLHGVNTKSEVDDAKSVSY